MTSFPLTVRSLRYCFQSEASIAHPFFKKKVLKVNMLERKIEQYLPMSYGQ